MRGARPVPGPAAGRPGPLLLAAAVMLAGLVLVSGGEFQVPSLVAVLGGLAASVVLARALVALAALLAAPCR